MRFWSVVFVVLGFLSVLMVFRSSTWWWSVIGGLVFVLCMFMIWDDINDHRLPEKKDEGVDE